MILTTDLEAAAHDRRLCSVRTGLLLTTPVRTTSPDPTGSLGSKPLPQSGLLQSVKEPRS
jgi:hypothetical protein